jgi:hypothetical protein
MNNAKVMDHNPDGPVDATPRSIFAVSEWICPTAGERGQKIDCRNMALTSSNGAFPFHTRLLSLESEWEANDAEQSSRLRGSIDLAQILGSASSVSRIDGLLSGEAGAIFNVESAGCVAGVRLLVLIEEDP